MWVIRVSLSVVQASRVPPDILSGTVSVTDYADVGSAMSGMQRKHTSLSMLHQNENRTGLGCNRRIKQITKVIQNY